MAMTQAEWLGLWRLKNNMKTYIATTNEGKIKEIKSALESAGIELISLDVDFDQLEDELKKNNCRDMVEISKAKAIEVIRQISDKNLEVLPVITDDAGIYFERLGDLPGIDTKTFVKQNGGIDGIKKMINEGERAYFQNVISYFSQDMKEPATFMGRVDGKLSALDNSIEIEKGFPFNHIFKPDGDNRFMFQIPLSERVNFSHRLKAAQKLNQYLQEKVEHKLKIR